MKRQFFLFILVGGFAAAVNLLSRMALSLLVNLELAIVLAFLLAMTVAYTLNRRFVFISSGRTVQDEYVRFGIVNLVALVQVFLITIGLDRYLFPMIGMEWHKTVIAHGIGVASPVFTSYLAHKLFTFSAKPES